VRKGRTGRERCNFWEVGIYGHSEDEKRRNPEVGGFHNSTDFASGNYSEPMMYVDPECKLKGGERGL
jgi:hypothetical protein